MLKTATRFTAWAIAVAFAMVASLASAQDNQWQVAKVSGEAWIGGAGAQPSSMASAPTLRPGDTIRTGRNGRVLLTRGAESILVSPNSSISLPEAGRPGMTTVIQQAGSILLDVEKRNVQHFEVETPYLAAVVKGTQFRVSLAAGRAQVNVTRGQVQVSDFRSGQFALVLPGQTAQALATGTSGLQLSGQGILSPIQQGRPQTPRVAPLAVPGRGLGPAPRSAPLQRATSAASSGIEAARAGARPGSPAAPGLSQGAQGGTRISAPIGEMKLDIHSVTRGMTRSETAPTSQAARRGTVWNTGELNPGSRTGKATAVNSGNAKGSAEISSGAAGAAASIASTQGNSGTAARAGVTEQVPQATSSSGLGLANGNASGNGNSGSGNNKAGGNGNGNGNSGSGNGNAGGNGNGNGNSGSGNSAAGGNGNGNGNSGSGNSNAGGNGNGNGNSGSGNSNAGGNGNGNGNSGSGNSNAGGNGNGNGNSGSGNSNAGGNGNGNGNSGSGNSNAGGNGNGNGNSGSGNSNAGGNGNGKSKDS